MGMNPNWARWVFASVSTYFDANRQGLALYIEGTDKLGRRTDKDYLEFSLNGPYITELSAGFWELLFDVNVLVCSLKDAQDTHRIFNNVGIVTTMFAMQIPIYKLGRNSPDPDDQSLIDCALLETEGRNGGVLINHFGQFDPTLPVVQSTVEGSYKLFITT